jgi:hypothetical protein
MRGSPALRGLFAWAASATAIGALAVPALATSGVKCATSTTYGSSCIDVHGTGLRVNDVQAWFTPPNNDYFSHQTWAFRLTTYGCDPRGKTERQCRPVDTYYSTRRHGNPAQQGQQCTTLGNQGISFQQCQSYGLAYADANFQAWRRFKVPRRYRFDHWICVDVATLRNHRWRRNGEPRTPGVRGCAKISG